MMLYRQAWAHRRTVGAAKGSDAAAFVEASRTLRTTPHISQNLRRAGGSALDRRTTRHPGYTRRLAVGTRNQRAFWLAVKSVGGLRKVKLRGLAKVNWLVVFAAAAFNLWRLPKLLRPART